MHQKFKENVKCINKKFIYSLAFSHFFFNESGVKCGSMWIYKFIINFLCVQLSLPFKIYLLRVMMHVQFERKGRKNHQPLSFVPVLFKRGENKNECRVALKSQLRSTKSTAFLSTN